MSNIITFEEVQNRIKNKTLEELSSQDIFDRYFVYGTEKEQNNPVIQKLMIEARIYWKSFRYNRHYYR